MLRVSVFAIAAIVIWAASIVPTLAGDDAVGQVCGLNPQGDNYLSFRTCGNSSCREMLRLGPGTIVYLLDRRGGWYEVQLSGGQIGWVFGRYICAPKSPS